MIFSPVAAAVVIVVAGVGTTADAADVKVLSVGLGVEWCAG